MGTGGGAPDTAAPPQSQERKHSMEQKTAIVTGGAGASAGGSGRHISQRLAGMGYFVAIWDIQDEAGRRVAAQIREQGGQAIYIHCDVCDEAQVKEALAQTCTQTGRVDALVNNVFWHADVQPPLHEVTLEDWDRHMEINLRCHFIVCKHVIPLLLAQPESVIVNIGTTGARRGEDGYAAYSAAKAGLESLTRSIAAQYGRSGLRCNCLVPGLVLEPEVDARMAGIPAAKAAFDRIDRQALLALGHGDGACVADAAAFLVSDASRWMTGESLVLDGGAISHSAPWADGRAAQHEN